MKYVIDYIEETLDEYGMEPEDSFNLLICTDNILESNIHDYAKYFFPNAVTYSETGMSINGTPDPGLMTFIYAEDERLNHPEKGTADDAFYEALLLSPTGFKTYYNIRYKTDITWYRKCVAGQ